MHFMIVYLTHPIKKTEFIGAVISKLIGAVCHRSTMHRSNKL